jgi:indole-3-glycerol phosphate synthase
VSVLDRIVDATREHVARRREAVPLSELEGRLAAPRDDRPFREALTRPGVSLIAEHKRRSPSAGEIRAGATVADIVTAYERGGAAALSILTEGPHFGGSLDDLREALDLDLDVLVEVHSEDELDRALGLADPDVIGINNRDLVDFSVDVERTYELLSDVPAGKTVVSESGFHTREQLEDLERVGVDAVLIGETLMRAPDPELAARELCGGEGDGEPY